MKKTSGNKSRATPEEKEQRPTAAAPAKAKAAPPVKEAPPRTPAKEPKTRAPRASKAAPAAQPPEVAPPETAAPRRRKSDEDEKPSTRGKGGRGSRAKSGFGFDDELMQDYVMDDEAAKDELDQELVDPLEMPLELLDPELVEVPRPAAAPKPKPKPVISKRVQTCAHCGNTFMWLSVEQLCFNCLKRKLAQRKREDETYSGFTGEAEEEEDAS